MINCLIASGCDITKRRYDNKTAGDIAEVMHYEEVSKALVEGKVASPASCQVS